MDQVTSHTGATPPAPPALPDGRFSLPTQALALVPGLGTLPLVIIQKDGLFLPDGPDFLRACRLVVCLPAGKVDEAALARRVWQLAASSGLSVLYLALAPKDDQAASLRRWLAELATLSGDRVVHARGEVSREKHWPQALRSVLQPGDLLVCLADHRVRHGLARSTSLGRLLAEKLSRPVYLLGGVAVAPTSTWWQQIKALRAWAISIAVIVGFFFLQVGIDHSAVRPASTIMLCLSALAEIYFLMQFNEWIG